MMNMFLEETFKYSDLFGHISCFTRFKGGGGHMRVPPPPPTSLVPEPEKAKEDLFARLRRARSRSLSRITEPGLLREEPNVYAPELTDVLGIPKV